MWRVGRVKKIKGFCCFFNLVGPISLLSAEKRTERSIVYGLRLKKKHCKIMIRSLRGDIKSSQCFPNLPSTSVKLRGQPLMIWGRPWGNREKMNSEALLQEKSLGLNWPNIFFFSDAPWMDSFFPTNLRTNFFVRFAPRTLPQRQRINGWPLRSLHVKLAN